SPMNTRYWHSEPRSLAAKATLWSNRCCSPNRSKAVSPFWFSSTSWAARAISRPPSSCTINRTPSPWSPLRTAASRSSNGLYAIPWFTRTASKPCCCELVFPSTYPISNPADPQPAMPSDKLEARAKRCWSRVREGGSMKTLVLRLSATAAAALLLTSAYTRMHSASVMADAANAFLASLTPEQRAQATFKFNDDERLNWHFIPRVRKGLPMRDMTGEQKQLAHALLAAGLSQQGYIKASSIMSLDQVLKV